MSSADGIMAAAVAPEARPEPSRLRRRLLALLLVPLSAVPIMLAVAATDPARFEVFLGPNSAPAAALIAVAAGFGLVLTPVLGVMGRIGAAVLAIPVVVLLINDTRTTEPGPGSTGALSLDMLLSMMVPTGYFLLLFGALRAAGWARSGSAVALGAAATLSVAVWLIPSPPVSDILMSSRMVSHGLINAGIIVSAAAFLWELMMRRPAAPAG